MNQLSERYLEDFAVGQTFGSGRLRIEGERALAFAAEFDPQPFHLDEAAARCSRADLGPNAEFDSGVRKSEVTVRQQGLFTIRNGMEAYGNEFTSFLAASFEQCQQNCSQRSICNIFTWSRSNRVCYLFERAELRKSGFFDSGLRN